MRSDFSIWMWIIVLFLLLTGTISLGDIFGLIFGIIGFFIMMALIGVLIFRYKVRKAQREASERGEEFRGYTWRFGGFQNTSRPSNPNEGRVRVDGGTTTKKRVSDDVGEYVDFKED